MTTQTAGGQTGTPKEAERSRLWGREGGGVRALSMQIMFVSLCVHGKAKENTVVPGTDSALRHEGIGLMGV
jgi:hypothetical protein